MWLIFCIVAVVIVLSVILVVVALRACCKFRENKDQNLVSLSFPLPPPTGDSDDIMDDTQYDSVVRAFREPDYESGEARIERKEDYLPNVPPRRDKAKLSMEEQTQAQSKKGCFLFEAPPPYEEVDKVATTQSGERRRMVSIKMPDLPVLKVGDTQIIERRMASTQSLSVTTKTALSTSRTATQLPHLKNECTTQGTVEGGTPLHTPANATIQSTGNLSSEAIKPEEGNKNEKSTLKIPKPCGEESINSTPTQSLKDKDAEIQDARKKS